MNILWDVNEREGASCVRRTTSRYRCYEYSSTNFSMPFKGSRPDVERRYKLFAPSSSSAPVECIAPAAPLLLPSEKYRSLRNTDDRMNNRTNGND